MKPSALFEAIHALISQRGSLHIWGSCGVGKSQIVAQVAKSINYEFLDIRAVQLDPVDLRGLPRISGDQAEWVPPKFLPTGGDGILFLDDLTSAPQMTQAGCYQLVLDRKLGECQLPDGWVVIAAGKSSVGARRAFLDAAAAAQPVRSSRSGTGFRGLDEVGGEGWYPPGDPRLPALQIVPVT
jgi:predicted AAA+ superfamily ATPase